MCSEERPLSDFRRNTKTGYLQAYCGPCERQWKRAHYRKNPEKGAAATREWRKRNPGKAVEITRRWQAANPEKVAQYRRTSAERHKGTRYRNNYGLSIATHEALWQFQAGRCAICYSDLATSKKVVDHAPNGEVRGLLCSRCNIRLGWFERMRWAVLAYENQSTIPGTHLPKGKWYQERGTKR